MDARSPTSALAAAGLASGAALSLSFFSADQSWLAWIALVPLLLVARVASAWQAFAAGLLCGAVAAVGTFSWLLAVPAIGVAQFIVLAGYVALYPAGWCVGILLLARTRLPLVLTAPVLWVAFDAARTHAGFLALPWATLAQSQHENVAVLQVAALGGEAAVTFIVVLGNAAIASLIALREWRSAMAAALIVGSAHAGGGLVLALADPGQPLSVAAVQPSIGVHERDDPSGREAIWQRLDRLTREAAQARPAVIVWPETAVGDPRHDRTVAARLASLSLDIKVPLVVGAAETEKFVSAKSGTVSAGQRDIFNSAYFVVDGAPLGEPYRKRKLVPFGEYLPLRDTVAWPLWLVPEIVDGQAGESAEQFLVARLGESDSRDKVRLGVLICWENMFAEFSREAVKGGAQVLVQLTNDVWFGRTRASAQHNAASVLRAVENRVPVVIASNTGPSQIIDAHGRVLARIGPLFSEGVVQALVNIGQAGTHYTRTGDVLPIACLALSGLAFLLPKGLATAVNSLQLTTLVKEAK